MVLAHAVPGYICSYVHVKTTHTCVTPACSHYIARRWKVTPSPQKRYVKVLTESVNVTVFGIRVFADVINLRISK